LGAFRTQSRDSWKGRFRSCGERVVRLVSRRHGELEACPRVEQKPPRHDLHGAQLEHRHESERVARMTPERWQQIKAGRGEEMEKPTGERDAFIDDASGNDTELKREVRSLLAVAHATGDGSISSHFVPSTDRALQ